MSFQDSNNRLCRDHPKTANHLDKIVEENNIFTPSLSIVVIKSWEGHNEYNINISVWIYLYDRLLFMHRASKSMEIIKWVA